MEKSQDTLPKVVPYSTDADVVDSFGRRYSGPSNLSHLGRYYFLNIPAVSAVGKITSDLHM